MATPLLLRLPVHAHTGVRHAPVQNLDLVPTLLDYRGSPPTATASKEGACGR